MQKRNAGQTGPSPIIPQRLTRFIRRTVEQKQRSGCTKLQLRRFRAAALTLAYTRGNVPLRELAKRLRVSQLQIRNWRAQPRFKRQVNELAKRYAYEFVGVLDKKPSFSGESYAFLAKEFPYYSAELCNEITNTLKNLANSTGLWFGFDSEQVASTMSMLAIAVRLWTTKLERTASKKERLFCQQARFEIHYLISQFSADAFMSAMKTGNYQLAQELFYLSKEKNDEQLAQLDSIEKDRIEHERR